MLRNKGLIIVITFLLLALLGYYFWQKAKIAGESQKPSSPLPFGKPCTQEAKVCPDGSAVGRTGPNCEFAPCPNPNPNY